MFSVKLHSFCSPDLEYYVIQPAGENTMTNEAFRQAAGACRMSEASKTCRLPEMTSLYHQTKAIPTPLQTAWAPIHVVLIPMLDLLTYHPVKCPSVLLAPASHMMLLLMQQRTHVPDGVLRMVKYGLILSDACGAGQIFR